MTDSQIVHKLAAVLAADVSGYSRLMQDDAPATVESLDSCRALFRGRIAAMGGRVVDTSGDSVLAVFELATKAIEAAVAIQDDLAARNEPVPDDRRMRYRIGIHLGEVLHKPDGTVYGDGVNIAARLESLADAGGICVSGVVHDIAAGKLTVSFDDAGEHTVKNIARPVRAWKIGGGPKASVGPASRAALNDDGASIAVLPFDNMSQDEAQAYFSDGITEDIITDLSKVPGLFVIARNSSFVYKGGAYDLKDVSRSLGVRYVLEGSVRKAGNRVRITCQLIDGQSGGHVWAERYDRELEDVFAVQDEVTATIVGQLSLHLAPQRSSSPKRDHRSVDAWEHYLRGREATWRLTEPAMEKAVLIFGEVLEQEPDFAAAHAMLGVARFHQYINGWGEEPDAQRSRGLASANRAVELDPSEPLGHFAEALWLQYVSDWDGAMAAAERALELDPNHSLSHAALGSTRLATGHPKEAIAHLSDAMRLDPYHSSVLLHLTALAHYMLGDYERARAFLEQRLAMTRETDSTPLVLAACFGRLGEPEAAEKAWRQVFEVSPSFSIDQRRDKSLYRDKQHFDDIIEGLRMAGIDPQVRPD